MATPKAPTAATGRPSTPAPALLVDARVVAAPAFVGVSGWGNPVLGRLTSSFGHRNHPVFGTYGMHAGQDIAAACGTPVHAAAPGTVLYVGGAFQGRTGNQVVIGHGDGIVTRYGHLLTGSIAVSVGDAVVAGQKIAGVGGDSSIDPFGAGNSTGCHLHFEVNGNNGLTPIDPLAFLAARGVSLGTDTVRVLPVATTAQQVSDVEETKPADAPSAEETIERIRTVLGEGRHLAALRFVG